MIEHNGKPQGKNTEALIHYLEKALHCSGTNMGGVSRIAHNIAASAADASQVKLTLQIITTVPEKNASLMPAGIPENLAVLEQLAPASAITLQKGPASSVDGRITQIDFASLTVHPAAALRKLRDNPYSRQFLPKPKPSERYASRNEGTSGFIPGR
jgi:hypothetical protein